MEIPSDESPSIEAQEPRPMEEGEITSVRALLGLAIVQIEQARSRLGVSRDVREAALAIQALRSVGIATGVLEYLGTTVYGFSGEERFGLPGYWTQAKLEGIAMASEFSSKFPGVIDNSVDISLYTNVPSPEEPDVYRITDKVRIALFDVLGTGRAVNAVKIEFQYDVPSSSQVLANWMGVWQASDGIFLEAVQLQPAIELSGKGTFVINPGGLMLE